MKKYNDDLIMACAIACWVSDTAYAENKKDVAYKQAFLNSMGKADKILSTSIPGMSGHKQRASNKEMQKAKDKYEQFSWLLKG